MSTLRLTISISLDGFVAGPDQSVTNPLGVGGMQLHEWAFRLESWRKPHGMTGGVVTPSSAVVEEAQGNVGATIMGRNMFGGHPGPWKKEQPWNGWWGENPPYHHPVFVLTHHARDPLPMEGGTIFTFVTDGIESALEQARAAARGKDVLVAGGAKAAQQYLAAGLVEQIDLNLVPVLLGRGERLFDNLGDPPPRLELVREVAGEGVTHLRYRVG
jgi:dihydrofolate reductase